MLRAIGNPSWNVQKENWFHTDLMKQYTNLTFKNHNAVQIFLSTFKYHKGNLEHTYCFVLFVNSKLK